MDISIPDPLRAWVETRVESGGYVSAEDYVSDLIHRDRLSLADHDALITDLAAGEGSGISLRQVPDIIAALKAEFAGTER